jgi:hypothetical protein
MSNPEIARILQNMIDEAEENVTRLEEIARIEECFDLSRARPELAARRNDIAEAMALIEELQGDF